MLEPYMTENFVMTSFQRMGEQPQNVKIMKNKFTGEPAGYCFVHFASDDEAVNAMHKLNGKLIPKTQPPVRFKLNHAGSTGRPSPERDYSLWVGDLTAEVDDYTLYKTFASRFLSIRAAKVIMDSSGFSKGYGFVRFAKESEQKSCLEIMNGYRGLGGKPLKISNAVPKAHRLLSINSPPLSGVSISSGYYSTCTAPGPAYVMPGTEYAGYYEPSYWPESLTWQGGYYEYPQAVGDPAALEYDVPEAILYTTLSLADMEPIDHSPPLDIDAMNQATILQDSNMWDALEKSKWLSSEDFEERLLD